jgi:competence protein ComEA
MKKMSMLIAGLVFSLMSMATFAAVNINTADAQAIQQELNGVGSHKAAAIVAYRDMHGSFASADELTNVKGIGIKTVEKNRSNIIVDLPESSN